MPVKTATRRFLKSPLVDLLVGPHGVDRYLELIRPELTLSVNLTAGPVGLLFVTTDTAVWAAVPGPGKDFDPVTAQARAAASGG